MKIWNDLDQLRAGRLEVVASIGNYDGVHRGHQAILGRVVEHAERLGVSSLLITFDPHPLRVVAPERAPRLIQTRAQKLEALRATKLTDVVLLPFDNTMARLSGTEFFDRVILPHLKIRAMHVGENFRFGRQRSGDLEVLRTIGERQKFEVYGLPAVQLDGEVISSSRIRDAVERGDVARARQLLGRPFSVAGPVVRGDGRGRKMDFPTANLELDQELLPAAGVYVSESLVLAARHPSVTNVGVRPTFGESEMTVETHLLYVDEDLYGEQLELRFIDRIRDEMRFSGPLELANQIARDRAATEAYFANLPLRLP